MVVAILLRKNSNQCRLEQLMFVRKYIETAKRFTIVFISGEPIQELHIRRKKAYANPTNNLFCFTFIYFSAFSKQINPRGRPKVTAGSNHYVHPLFIFKQNKAHIHTAMSRRLWASQVDH